MKFPEQIFITGTDTGIGKTVVSTILTLGLNALYWKPIQSGLDFPTDTDWVRRNTGLPERHFAPETYRLTQPLSPHESARLDHVQIELDQFVMPEQEGFPHLVVEGAGGIMVPINEKEYLFHLAKQFDLPVVLVAKSGLGTINHTLLSIEKLKSEGLAIFGVVLNGPKNEKNREAIEFYGKVKVIGELGPLANFQKETLQEAFLSSF